MSTELATCLGDDGTLHFSDLKWMALSPAHYLYHVRNRREPTRAMRVGTVTHYLVLGPRPDKPLVCYEGDRKGNAWAEFARLHRDAEIVTRAEWADALMCADAIKSHPIAKSLLDGARTEVPLAWSSYGIPCSTGGLDIVGTRDGSGYIAELKTTTCAEPLALARHSTKLLYHAQMAWYEEGARENGIDTSGGAFILGAEVDPPHAVTGLRCTPQALAQGRKSCALWLEKLRQCIDNDHWPEYTQTILDYELPPWMGADGEVSDEDGGA